MIPPDHSVLNVHSMEAEATGLLDRMLGALQEINRYELRRLGCKHNAAANQVPCFVCSNVLVMDATLNSLSILVRMRPSLTNRTLNAILSFNPFAMANLALTPKTKVMIRSLEKTVRMLCIHLSRR
jgi:symplekin